ncbi:MAG: glycosyltransferase [Acidobacteria bacterium]|nr:glycosyltransferase [Acidobacteriota bacterium]MBV9474636.1 glycosyltransferase [Acidobacteriota bacterium]
MSRHCTVSIVMPFRDAAATLPECIASIEAQTFRDFEVVAIDDRSHDDSAALCRRAGFRVLAANGLVDALNTGLAAARGTFIARMDADDVMHPERLAAQLELIERGGHDVVATQVELFPDDAIGAGYREYIRWQNAVLTPEDVDANLYVESPFAHPSVLMRRGFAYANGAFPEDYELWLRLHAEGRSTAKVPRVLLRWRESATRASRTDPRYARAAFDRLRARYLARDPRVANAQRIVIWGAGQLSRRRVRLLVDQGIRFDAWVDIDPRKIGRQLWGIPIHPHDWLAEQRTFVLIYVTNHHARDWISETLTGWGYRIGHDFLAVG